MFVTNLTAEQRLSRAVVSIMGHERYVALAGILMIGERTVVDDHATAYTDGRDEGYSRAFIEQLNDAELRFLILHENYHKLYRHLHIWRWMYEEDAELANMACDYVINLKLVDDNADGFATMTGALTCGCYDEKYRGMDAAQVYRELRQDDPRKNLQGQGDGTGAGEDGEDNTGVGQQSFDEHKWDEAKELSEDDKRELAKEIDEAIRQGALAAGKLGNGMDRELQDLLEPQVNWREVLRDFVTDTCSGSDYSSYNKLNRRWVHLGVAMPSGVTERVNELVVLADMSGSIGQREQTIMLTEVAEVCKTVHPNKLRILYWDTDVRRDEVYEMDQIEDFMKSTKPAGGGGTDIEPVARYMQEHGINPDAAIILTDGYLFGSWGQWACPTLWCILDNKSAKPPVGKTVHIKSREM